MRSQAKNMDFFFLFWGGWEGVEVGCMKTGTQVQLISGTREPHLDIVIEVYKNLSMMNIANTKTNYHWP